MNAERIAAIKRRYKSLTYAERVKKAAGMIRAGDLANFPASSLHLYLVETCGLTSDEYLEALNASFVDAFRKASTEPSRAEVRRGSK